MSAVDQDEIFDLLANARRRQMLRHLDDVGVANLQEIAKAIASIEEDCPAEELTEQAIRRVYISLYQYHVPEMEEAGVVSREGEYGITLTEEADVALAYLNFSPGQERPESLLSTARGIMGGESR